MKKLEIIHKPLQNKDLRIGNLIVSGNNGKFDNQEPMFPGKVLSIGNSDQEFEQIYCESIESFDWFFKDNYFGIPLTVERLGLLGFSYRKAAGYGGQDMWAGLSWVTKDDIVLRGEPNDLRLIGFFNTRIQYVHELQNLWFILTKKELDVNKLFTHLSTEK